MTHAYLSFSMQEISGGAELTCAKKRTLQPAPMEAVVRASFKAEEMSGGIWLTFTQASQPELTSANGVDLASEKSSEKSSEKILQHLKGEPGLSARALAERMGIGSRAVEKQINLLKKEGHLVRIGPAKGGYWSVIE